MNQFALTESLQPPGLLKLNTLVNNECLYSLEQQLWL